jgi:hypothetical protein
MSIRDAAASRELTLVELVDRLLGKGVVISGDITLAVADIDLVKVELRALVASVDSLAGDSGRARLEPPSAVETIGTAP